MPEPTQAEPQRRDREPTPGHAQAEPERRDRGLVLERALAEPGLRDLPPRVAGLLRAVGAPPRLGAHLRAVYDVAVQLLDALGEGLGVDRAAVLFGAATHDIGKARFPAELSGPGAQHEAAGRELLLELGVDPRPARFAALHGHWDRPGADLDELLVTLADKVWKGRREAGLEQEVAERVAAVTGEPVWSAFMRLDDELTRIAAGADERLALQSRFPVRAMI